MSYVPIEKLLQHSDNSAYKLVIMVARRARQIAGGDKPLVKGYNPDKPLRTALEEAAQGLITVG
jgi:DNA-directed RNA polymerase omega subunit